MVPNNNRLDSPVRKDYSQNGEDRIVGEILLKIPDKNKNNWCVEFGAWDGKYLSNTYNLIENKEYSAILIEGDLKKYEELVKNFESNSKVHPIHDFVGHTDSDSLDIILAKTSIPKYFDVLSIDIDGNDYHVWSKTKLYVPLLVVIEYNPTIPDEIEFIQKSNSKINQGASITSIVKLGKDKGYELISTTVCNAFFILKEHYSLFNIQDNSVHALRTDRRHITYIFQGYDGTIFIEGNTSLSWHGFKFGSLQQLPRFLRRFPSNYNTLQRISYYLFNMLNLILSKFNIN